MLINNVCNIYGSFKVYVIEQELDEEAGMKYNFCGLPILYITHTNTHRHTTPPHIYILKYNFLRIPEW